MAVVASVAKKTSQFINFCTARLLKNSRVESNQRESSKLELGSKRLLLNSLEYEIVLALFTSLFICAVFKLVEVSNTNFERLTPALKCVDI